MDGTVLAGKVRALLARDDEYVGPGETVCDWDDREANEMLVDDDISTREYGVEEIRRRGRPTIGTGPAQLVPVRIDPELLDSPRSCAARGPRNQQ